MSLSSSSPPVFLLDQSEHSGATLPAAERTNESAVSQRGGLVARMLLSVVEICPMKAGREKKDKGREYTVDLPCLRARLMRYEIDTKRWLDALRCDSGSR